MSVSNSPPRFANTRAAKRWRPSAIGRLEFENDKSTRTFSRPPGRNSKDYPQAGGEFKRLPPSRGEFKRLPPRRGEFNDESGCRKRMRRAKSQRRMCFIVEPLAGKGQLFAIICRAPQLLSSLLVLLVEAHKLTTSREMLLWMTPSEAPKALQASECSELLDPMRASCWISAQH